MRTDFETLKQLALYTVNHLSENNCITYGVENRAGLADAMATEYGVSLATDEDIEQQAMEEVEDKFGKGAIEGDVSESEVYNHAKKEIIKSFHGESISGLYLVESVNQMAKRITSFLMSCDLVDDVFWEDDQLIDFLVKKIRFFSIKTGPAHNVPTR